MAASPFISFIICTYNRAAYVDQALGSLVDQTVPGEQSCELLIIDNNSSDHTAGVVQKYKKSLSDTRKKIRYAKETTQGISFARNRGIRESQAPYIVFLDDDIEATDALIKSWISFFTKHPDALAAGGKIHVRFDDPPPAWISHFLMPMYGRHDLGSKMRKYPPHKFPFGGNMGVKKSVFGDVGEFNTGYGQRGDQLEIKGEEKELSQRIRSVTSDIYYLPQAFVYHHVDGNRLTEKYLKKHAIGIGRGLKKQMDNASLKDKVRIIGREILKSAGTVILALGYTLGLQFPKAGMLVKFRRWVWGGINICS